MSENEIACLYIVATPIGNLADMSQRAIEILQSVDVIAAEDTRHSGFLLQHFAIKTPSVSLHDHNEQQRSETLLTRLQQGESIALISDAGTPLISDPGYKLVSLVREHGIPVIPIPGSCAVIAALSASGLPSDRFSFEGFLPSKQGARLQTLEKLATDTRTLIFYDSPRRLQSTLIDMVTIFGEERRVCLARELTKLHETINTKPLAELLDWVSNDPNQQRGECVLLVEGAKQHQDASEVEVNRVLNLLLKELPVKKAAAITSALLGVSKNNAYDMALKLQHKD
ncbi:MAG: 16S rRNA (cytidine(1402)-2'-O)-methyltransferase [Pseudomonadota bacterium]|nr:16S rRNA (cytidine(1402)-2'-O)-methyltransferase [Pseudomonadota bacterium]MDO7711701.1 16S rRNA (cytidine(1402)-2'-O)-methyltransferase [Pseudomonadota bacterium]